MELAVFRERFKKLSNIEQDMLKVMVVAYEKLTQERLFSILKTCDMLPFESEAPTSSKLKIYEELLLESGWITLSNDQLLAVNPQYFEWLMRMAVVDPRYRKIVLAVRAENPFKGTFVNTPQNLELCLRELRMALYDGDIKTFENLELELESTFSGKWPERQFWESFFKPFDPGWIGTFPEKIQQIAVTHLFHNAIKNLEPVEDLADYVQSNPLKDRAVYEALAAWYFLTAEFKSLEKLILEWGHDDGILAYQELLPQFTITQHKKAIPHFDKIPSGFAGVLSLLVLLKNADQLQYEKIIHLARGNKRLEFHSIFKYLSASANFQLNQVGESNKLLSVPPETMLDSFFQAICSFWSDHQWILPEMDKLRRVLSKAETNGYKWLAMQSALLLSEIEHEGQKIKDYRGVADRLGQSTGTESMITFVKIIPKWQRVFSALSRMNLAEKYGDEGKDRDTRLVWWIDFENEKLIPVEQVFGSNGWSKGRVVSLLRLKEHSIDNMTKQDRKAAKAIISEKGHAKIAELEFDYELALSALAGHPLLFLFENPSVSVELIENSPQLLIMKKEGGFELGFSSDFQKPGIIIQRETPTRYHLLKITPELLEINRHLGFSRMIVPNEGKQQLLEVAARLSGTVIVQSDLDVVNTNLTTIEGNSIISLHMLPIGDGFKLEAFVKPFTTDPPYFKPGEGRKIIIAEIDGMPTKAIRNLKLELNNLQKVIGKCPALQSSTFNYNWHFTDAESCLEVLLELEPLRTSGDVLLEFPKGEKLRIAGHVDFGSLSMGVRKNRDWFEVNGSVQVNENLVLDFKKMMELSQASNGRFLEISTGQFISLTKQLRKKIDEMGRLFQLSKTQIRMHPLAAGALEEISEEFGGFETDLEWKLQASRLESLESFIPQIPSNFKANLRDYQKEGFNWLSRMAQWGVGACLADDMGLGKTIQALAMIVDRATSGPSLVVAPASVVSNWMYEIERFAPTLRPHKVTDNDRDALVRNLGSQDILLCSYGMMQQMQEQLSEVGFSTIVLDEAQAIKNRNTKRSKAAMSLQAGFKMVTTGTPIENHLGELWNIFNFLVPGLLGSIDRFNRNFAVPIERFGDTDCKAQLKQLLQPFILRRKKGDVLKELPAKTEITLTVSLSEEERAFYEALRREAVENIGAGPRDAPSRQFKILAELMKLRLACCHPKLVISSSTLKSSKLNLFIETVEELIAVGHKALVFSQFVMHLRIIEQWVKKRGITYQYLDGSTPIPLRDKAIKAYQSGEGVLFLISLKAGGFGLNLTAADYVIHLDPWWNPAVEDQASDRSHRIGQQKPVTIYRLIAENTIEQRIVQLHAEKRELADSLLEGTDTGARLTAEELLALIKE